MVYKSNTVISPYTQFRDLFYLTVSYNLFDFGVTGKKVHIAKKDFEQKQIAYNLQLKELKLKILDLYNLLACMPSLSISKFFFFSAGLIDETLISL